MATDPDIEPDTKNWTWVLERPCPDCGFDAAALDVTATGDAVRSLGATWRALLARPGVRTRRVPGTWSTLEYGCHVRDVLALGDRRLQLMLTVDDPHFENWDQDATAVQDAYATQDPSVVADQLAEAAERLAARFDAVEGPAWERPGRRSDGVRFTVESFARYLLHDPLHHVWDVRDEPIS